MARWIYTLCFYLLMPLILLRLGYRALRAPAYARRLGERFGFVGAGPGAGCLWVHAVSVGETIAAQALVKTLQQRYPQRAIVLTTTTPTGSERVQALFADSVSHCYAPYDLPGSVQRFLARMQPAALIIMETELWPNTIHYCAQGGVAVLLANARLSAKSARGYQRFAALSRPMVQQLDAVAAQSPMDGERFEALGLAPQRLQVTGSIKFDISLPPALQRNAEQLRSTLTTAAAQRLVVVAASTHEGEEAMLLQALAGFSAAEVLLILVPRHPERFERVLALCQQRGLQTVRRSSGAPVNADTQVWVGDTMGELLLFCGCADIVFVGGSLVVHGGHNLLEPAAWGRAIVTGSSLYNFLNISDKLTGAGALTVVEDADELSMQLSALIKTGDRRRQMGAAALQVVAENRGALAQLLALVETVLPPST
ncbi:MAG: 3-deoxy-D-manno-octulosonic-acid transferase [Paraglaciecola psychrophila]|jgi:3-deoxy-D-manno-octulosonic-acid transferase